MECVRSSGYIVHRHTSYGRAKKKKLFESLQVWILITKEKYIVEYKAKSKRKISGNMWATGKLVGRHVLHFGIDFVPLTAARSNIQELASSVG